MAVPSTQASGGSWTVRRRSGGPTRMAVIFVSACFASDWARPAVAVPSAPGTGVLGLPALPGLPIENWSVVRRSASGPGVGATLGVPWNGTRPGWLGGRGGGVGARGVPVTGVTFGPGGGFPGGRGGLGVWAQTRAAVPPAPRASRWRARRGHVCPNVYPNAGERLCDFAPGRGRRADGRRRTREATGLRGRPRGQFVNSRPSVRIRPSAPDHEAPSAGVGRG